MVPGPEIYLRVPRSFEGPTVVISVIYSTTIIYHSYCCWTIVSGANNTGHYSVLLSFNDKTYFKDNSRILWSPSTLNNSIVITRFCIENQKKHYFYIYLSSLKHTALYLKIKP